MELPLISMNNPESARFVDIDTGTVYAIAEKCGTVYWEPVCTVRDLGAYFAIDIVEQTITNMDFHLAIHSEDENILIAREVAKLLIEQIKGV